MGRRKFWEPNPETMLEDLIRLAAESRPSHDWAAFQRLAVAARKANQRARSEEASAKRAAAQRKARPSQYRPRGRRIVDLLLACMEPGKWYGLGDVVRAAGLERSARGKFYQRMLPTGLIKRQKNPDWQPNEFGRPNESKWLYRLTPEGEALRRLTSLWDDG